VQHELFEYEGRISQLVRLVEIDMPQSLAVLTKIVRHLEDYQSLRAGNPRASYDSVSLAKDLWPDGEPASPGLSLSKSADGQTGDEKATGNESAATAGIETEGQPDATV
jgi:hypothetical protein